MKKTAFFFLFLTVLLAGCATWVMVGGSYTMGQQNFEVNLPEGWRRHNLTSNALLITRDGLLLQRIRIARMAVDKELAYTKKKLSKGMLPQEIAEVIIDNIRSNSNIMNHQIIENSPSSIGGHPGFKIVYSYQTKQGLNKKGLSYGFLLDEWYYEILYKAPARYYFSKYLPAFEKVKESFRISKDVTS